MSFPVTLYVRKDCPLCQEAEADLKALQVEIPHYLTVVDVDTDPDLQSVYGERVPVIKSGAFTFDSPFGLKELRWKLMTARDWHIQQAEDFGEQSGLNLPAALRPVGAVATHRRFPPAGPPHIFNEGFDAHVRRPGRIRPTSRRRRTRRRP